MFFFSSGIRPIDMSDGKCSVRIFCVEHKRRNITIEPLRTIENVYYHLQDDKKFCGTSMSLPIVCVVGSNYDCFMGYPEHQFRVKAIKLFNGKRQNQESKN